MNVVFDHRVDKVVLFSSQSVTDTGIVWTGI